MSVIQKVKAFTNGEIAYLSWTVSGMIPGCLGFEITRLYPDSPADNIILPSWVAFDGQSNKKWLPQNTSVWPIQKLSWKDLTLRKGTIQTVRSNPNISVQYHVRPVVAFTAGLEEVKTGLEKTYAGPVLKLGYVDEGKISDPVKVSIDHGQVRATFTNGILATQYLAHAMDDPQFAGIKKEIRDKNSPIRKYLAGDVLETLTMLLDKASKKKTASLKMALYELNDDELMEKILANKDRIEIILSNTSDDTAGEWDAENAPNRKILHDNGVQIIDRMFNNGSIGHNKFVIYLEKGVPRSVMTGSTNWTSNGLCAQSNNAVLIESPELAALYNNYFGLLKTDNQNFVVPDPLSKSTRNVQAAPIRTANQQGNSAIKLKDGTQVTVWFSPNTPGVSVNKKVLPPDLSQVYSLMRKAEKAIFFAVFLPGRANDWTGSDIMTNIITEAITLGEKDHSLMVYGAISDPSCNAELHQPREGQRESTDAIYLRPGQNAHYQGGEPHRAGSDRRLSARIAERRSCHHPRQNRSG